MPDARHLLGSINVASVPIGSVSFLDHPKATHYRDIARTFSKSLNIRVLKERHGSTVVSEYTTDCFNNGKVVYQRKGPYTLCHMNAYLYQYIIATPVLVMQIVIVIIGILMLTKQDRKIRAHVRKHGMIYGIIIAIAAIAGSLGFSEGYHYEPCELCWIQRIFHYPQLIIFAVGMYYRDMRAWTYSLWLAILGLIVGAYQVAIQFSPTLAESSICNLNPSSASCSEVLIQAYGYLTIPVMSVTFFVALIMLYGLSRNKKSGAQKI